MDGLYSKCINTYAITTLCLLFIQLAITLTVMSPPTTTSILFSILCRFMTLSQLSQFQFEVATQQNAKKKKKSWCMQDTVSGVLWCVILFLLGCHLSLFAVHCQMWQREGSVSTYRTHPSVIKLDPVLL